mmetsp:Transcript_80057/g.232435  ORF Transcript_80057/g.232435 Transcript_80057/m.232435 type:complete len:250 (+) Transcript_80057:280-1029(+)
MPLSVELVSLPAQLVQLCESAVRVGLEPVDLRALGFCFSEALLLFALSTMQVLPLILNIQSLLLCALPLRAQPAQDDGKVQRVDLATAQLGICSSAISIRHRLDLHHRQLRLAALLVHPPKRGLDCLHDFGTCAELLLGIQGMPLADFRRARIANAHLAGLGVARQRQPVRAALLADEAAASAAVMPPVQRCEQLAACRAVRLLAIAPQDALERCGVQRQRHGCAQQLRIARGRAHSRRRPAPASEGLC